MQLPKTPEAAVQMWAEMSGIDRADLVAQARDHEISLEDFCMQSLANHHIGATCQAFLGTAMAVSKPDEQSPEEFERVVEGVMTTLNGTLSRSSKEGSDMAVMMIEESARAALSAIDLYRSGDSSEKN
jgi:hypothetical protein